MSRNYDDKKVNFYLKWGLTTDSMWEKRQKVGETKKKSSHGMEDKNKEKNW